MNKKLTLACGSVIATFVAMPSAAQAVTAEYSYSGSDYSYNAVSGKAVAACDREDDGHTVKTEYNLTGSSTPQTWRNNDGPNTCSTTGTPAIITRHRIIEVIAIEADDVGPWVYPR